MINPRMISSIFLATNLNLISTKTSMDAAMDLWISWVSDCTTELKPAGFYDEMGEKLTAFQDGHHFHVHDWRSSKNKDIATYTGKFLETSAGADLLCVFFRLCDTFPLPQIVPSARNEAPENKTSHSDSDIVKSMSKNGAHFNTLTRPALDILRFCQPPRT